MVGASPAGPPIGGVAELPDADGTPLEAGDSSGRNPGVLVGVQADSTAGALALGGAAWYTQTRLFR